MSDQRYLVAARKYRPQRFDDVVAQEHVCDTLKNAIERDRVGHAYLFSGPRGVGKTTVARILAKSINCTTPMADRDGAEPCQTCDSCVSLGEGRSLNVIEIDAASNNKVDDVRELRDTVRVPPQGARKKVYIIDEVHMLTTQAFNALLKTLEEPPPYALFVFATTEPNKVLPTILSRCQRFDFRRIPIGETVERLGQIAVEEEIAVDEASLLLIAQKGDGALRDALSVFDQAVALCGANVTYEALADALGVVDVDLFFKTTAHVVTGSSAGVLDLVQHVMLAGFDLQEFLSGLSEHVRNLLVALTMPDTGLIEASAAVRKRYSEESQNFTQPALLRLLSIAAEAESTIRVSAQPRLQLELALLKMVNVSNTVDLRQALEKLDRLAATAGTAETSGTARSQRPATVVTDSSPTTPPPTRAAPDTVQSEAKTGGKRHKSSKPSGRAKGDVAGSPPATDIVSPSERSPAATALPATDAQVSIDPSTVAVEEVAHDGHPVPEASITGDRQASLDESDPDPDSSVETKPGISESARPTASGTAGVPDLFGPPALSGKAKRNGSGNGTIEGSAARSAVAGSDADREAHVVSLEEGPAKNWLPFVKAVKAERIHVGSLLQHTAPSGWSGSSLVVDVPDDFHRRLLENQQDFLVRHVRQSISESILSIRFLVRQSVKPPDGETAEDFDPHEYMQRKRQSNPVIKAIFDEFGGELVW